MDNEITKASELEQEELMEATERPVPQKAGKIKVCKQGGRRVSHKAGFHKGGWFNGQGSSSQNTRRDGIRRKVRKKIHKRNRNSAQATHAQVVAQEIKR